MKKVKIALLVLIAGVTVLTSCKKGKDDPFISLHSRDARITAKWKLTKIEAVDVHNAGATYTTTFDGTIYTETVSTGGSITATGSFEMTIDKQGSISAWAENYTQSGFTADVRSGTGTWMWGNSDKDRDFIAISNAGNNLFASNFYHIDELKSKEMILHYTSKTVNNGDADSYDDIYTFTKE
jgi:hypothetical protein